MMDPLEIERTYKNRFKGRLGRTWSAYWIIKELYNILERVSLESVLENITEFKQKENKHFQTKV